MSVFTHMSGCWCWLSDGISAGIFSQNIYMCLFMWSVFFTAEGCKVFGHLIGCLQRQVTQEIQVEAVGLFLALGVTHCFGYSLIGISESLKLIPLQGVGT